MKMLPKRINPLVFYALAWYSCQSNQTAQPVASPEVQELALLEEKLQESTGNAAKQEAAKELEAKLVRYSVSHRADTMSAACLYKAARINETYLLRYEEAFGLYESITTDYPNSRFAPVAIFKKGLLMETHFEKGDKAIYYLDEFLRRYPDHKLAPMAIELVQSAGVDADVLYQRIRQGVVQP
ncbi:MAG: tetratricopeptide repeat protein [Bacteroidetes bacterium]|nr:tetratricopeptide repeat protein [Bacteroidota bacterium]